MGNTPDESSDARRAISTANIRIATRKLTLS
jgi:hypothetical protein